jgi:SAM-dependent methyltransferase
MWTRFVDRLRCPLSGSPLTLVPFQQHVVSPEPRHLDLLRASRNAVDDRFWMFVDEGVLLSEAGWMFPIVKGLPILLPYQVAAHHDFAREHRAALIDHTRYRFPDERPAAGEQDVRRSFSEEWREYEYDGVLWDVSYEDNKERLLAEVGLPAEMWHGRSWVEIGCGIGMTTAQAQSLSGGDAVGIDLSIAILKASQQFRMNPFLHFAQASAFSLPLARQSFDIVYSRGVLHHTHSTKKAFMAMVPLARPGGRVYLWVYGRGSLHASPLRVVAFAAEAVLRPVLCRLPTAVTTLVLTPIAGAYLAFNAFRRSREQQVQPYTFDRALHAARDRFTPRYAYRQSHAEVTQWFKEAGCQSIEPVNPAAIPAADRDDYRRNTGVRATAS